MRAGTPPVTPPADAPPAVPPKPRLRGRIHQVAAFVSLPAGVVLTLLAPGGSPRVATAIYAFTLVNMFVTSGTYHRVTWTTRGNDRMMRLDHSAIYLLIAGTYTPFSVIALEGVLRVALLASVWTVAVVMVVLKALRVYRLRVLYGVMYIALGWAAVIAVPQYVRELPLASSILMLVGGLLYTGGALVLNRHWPDPDPLVFGYHEVWHVFMTSAAACHYAAVVLLLLGLR